MIEIPLPYDVPEILAVGPFLKNTLCVTRGSTAFISEDIGSLDNPDTIRQFETNVTRLLEDTGVSPVAVAHDLHPDFPSTLYAEAMGLPTIGVQHHHAHGAAVMAEAGLDDPALALSLDGFGLGTDGGSWGGELLVMEGSDFRRIGHLAHLAQPGGDIAARQPWRMGAAALYAMGRPDEIETRYAGRNGLSTLKIMLERGLNSPPTSSAGRLFDAACGLLGVRLEADFEGQAPMELESLVSDLEVLDDGWTLKNGELDLCRLLESLLPLNSTQGANLFHGTLSAALADWVSWAMQETGTTIVALSGGCFHNKVLCDDLIPRLKKMGARPIRSEKLPPNDACISLGQAWVAALKLGETSNHVPRPARTHR